MKLSPLSVAVVVSDRKRAVQWYQKKLGMRVLDRTEHWVTVGAAGRGPISGAARLHLCQTSEFDPKAKLEPGNTGILFTVDGDIERAYRTLKGRGVKFPQPPKKEEWGWSCVFQDPDGNQFSLVPAY